MIRLTTNTTGLTIYMEAADEAEEEALEDHIEAKAVEAYPKETVVKKAILDRRNATSVIN